MNTPLASAWDSGLVDGLRRGLNTMGVNWTSIDALRIGEVGESSGTAIVWIGVEFGALSFKEGSVLPTNAARSLTATVYTTTTSKLGSLVL